MSKHTKGSWDWYWRFDNSTNEADCGVASSGGYSVCRAPRYQEKKQWEADARLIAAAPDMLEALERLVRRATRELADPEDVSELHFANSVIAKAIGTDRA